MGYIISMVFVVIISFATAFIAQSLKRNRDEDKQKIGRILFIAGSIVFFLWIGIHSGLQTIHQIPAGSVGVVYQFGSIIGQIDEGLQLVAPWKVVLVANIQVQRHLYEKLDCFSKETQDVYIRAILNTRVSDKTIQTLFREVGPNFSQVLIDPRVAQIFKDVAVNYNSVDIAPHREEIRKKVTERLEKELSPYSIEVVDLLLDNIDFSPAFKSAIEQKQIATQNALREEQNVTVQRHLAEQAVEKAKGEGGAVLEVATKQAEANRLLAESITPTLIQYNWSQKIPIGVQTILLPTGQNFILPPELLKGETK